MPGNIPRTIPFKEGNFYITHWPPEGKGKVTPACRAVSVLLANTTNCVRTPTKSKPEKLVGDDASFFYIVYPLETWRSEWQSEQS